MFVFVDTSPPKTILKLHNTLLDIGAVPGINLYFGGEQVEMKPEGPFLHQRFIDAQVTPHIASQVANHFRYDLDAYVDICGCQREIYVH